MKQQQKTRTPVEVKNIRTGERYITWKEASKTVIDGVEFTPVLYMGHERLIRSDSLRKIAVDRTKKTV